MRYATGQVTGNANYQYTGGLVGNNEGPISNSYATGNVSGSSYVGGLVGYTQVGTAGGNISNSHATGQVTGTGQYVGGLVGVTNGNFVTGSYATGTVSGGTQVGGLVGAESNGGTISNSYATGNVTGTADVGGLVGLLLDPQVNLLSNAFYNVDQVTINGAHQVTAGGLFNAQYVDWFSHGETLNIANYSASLPAGTGGFYNVSTTQGLEDLLGFSESNAGLNFRLTANLSLPQGFYIPYFAGSFDGGGYTLANLTLDTDNSNLGLFGYLPSSSTTIANVGVSGVSVTGYNRVGGLVGYDKGGAAISNSYANGSITGGALIGGLVGRLASGGSIANSYFSGSVTETSYAVGGLVGANYGTISNSYAMGGVTGTIYYIGGLAGLNYGTVTNSFYDKTSNPTLTGLSNYYGSIADVAGQVEGLTTAQFQTAATFTTATSANGNVNPAWSLSTSTGATSTWFMYAGETAPLLRSFLTPLVVGGATTQVYDRAAFAPSISNMVYSITPTISDLLGTLTVSGNVQGATNAGTYTYTPGGLYSNQQGYLLSYAASTLTITPAPLTVTGTFVSQKEYNGTTAASLAGGSLVGVLSGDTVSLIQAGTFASKNVGNGIAVTASDSLGGASAEDYSLTEPVGLTGNIIPALLTVTGTNVAPKVYNGTTAATLTGGALSGVASGDTITLTQSGSFASKNVGTGIAVTASDSIGGASSGDYLLIQPTGLTGSITPAPLTVTGTLVSDHVYNGNTAATLTSGALVGVISGDTVGLTQSGAFATKNAGTSIAVTATDGLTGANAGDYTLIEPTGLTGSITPATVTVTGTQATKVYNGTTTADLTGGVLIGVVSGDSVTLDQSGNYASPAVGTGIPVTVTDTLSGPSAGDYSIAEPTGVTGSITAASSASGTSGTISNSSALAPIATTTRSQLVANTYAPQFGATPQVINASPTIETLSATSAADDGGTGGDSSTSQRHKAVAVNVSMKIGATGTLKIENGGLKLPQTVIQTNE